MTDQPGESDQPDEQPPASVAGRRRQIQRAIRDGAEAPPAGLEDLAMRVAIRQASLGWVVVLCAVGVVVEVVSVALADSIGQGLLYAVLGLLFLAYGLVQRAQVRRARAAVTKWTAGST